MTEERIKQVKLPYQQLMTDLRATVDGAWVTYRRVEDGFAYIFEVLDTVSVETAESAARKIVQIFQDQSYDYGAEWRMTEFRQLDHRSIYWVFRADFRIKDSY